MPETEESRTDRALRLPAARWRLGERAIMALNLALFIGAGTLVCFWVWYYTDWVEEFGALLTLGGALSWLAFVLRIVPEDKIKTVQEAFFSAVFEKHGALPWQGLAMLAVTAGLFCFATVQIESVRESTERAVMVADEAEVREGDFWTRRINEEDFDVLQPGNRLRIVVPVWWSWKREFVVAVGGFPERRISLHPWERRDLIVPSSFRRPVLLLKPTATLLADHQLGPRMLIIRGFGAEREIPFGGRSLWIGCGRSVEVPGALRDEWQKQEGWAEHMQEWLFPGSLVGIGRDLVRGQKIEIALRKPDRTIEWSDFCVVDFDATRLDFSPQVFTIGNP